MDLEKIVLVSFIIRRLDITMVEEFWKESDGVIATIDPFIVKSFTIPEDKYGGHYWVSGFVSEEKSQKIVNNVYVSDPVAPLSFYDFLGAPYDYSTVQAYKISSLKLNVQELEKRIKSLNHDLILGKMYTIAMGSVGARGKPATLTMMVYGTLDYLHTTVMELIET